MTLSFENWEEKLKSVKHGSALSREIDWGFYDDDLKELAQIHKAHPKGAMRRKIEELLEDCNFHMECSALVAGDYDHFK